MTEYPVAIVYCDGVPGERHDRYIMTACQRMHANPAVASHWTPLDSWDGKRLHRIEQSVVRASRSAHSGENRSAWLRYHFACDVCGYDEYRNEDERQAGGRIDAVFNLVLRSGLDPEIPVRELIRQIDRLK